MALTNTFVDEFIWNKLYIRIYDITLDSNYPAGGYTAALGFSPQKYRLKTILGLKQLGGSGTASLVSIPIYDTATGKLMIMRANTTLLETAGGANLSTVKLRVMIFGR